MHALVWQWGRFGGGPRYALELSEALHTYCGADIQLSMAEGAEILAHGEHAAAVDLPVVTYESKVGFLARTLLTTHLMEPLMRRLDTFRPDVAIDTMPAYWDLFLIRKLRRLRIPLITIIHDATQHPGDNFLFAQNLQRRVIGASAAIVTLSDFVANRLQESGWLADALHKTIPHAVFDLKELNLAPPSVPDFAGDRPLRLLLAGRVKTYKGVSLLIEALHLLPRDSVHLRIAGAAIDPPEIEALRETQQVDLELKWLSDADFVAHIDWADVVVLPYVEASQSGVIPLAYKRARPVIATPVGGLPEQVKHERTGLITDELSATAIAGAVSRFCNNPHLLRSCAEGALALATGAWSWAQIAPRFFSLLEEVRPLAKAEDG